mmetsp:Transcript_9009/g.36796  ORF Transcript_9009/g.36796 Transcript_9009/m.36796 type:complete len:237 (+) Transcript_9009:2901-3611(+)
MVLRKSDPRFALSHMLRLPLARSGHNSGLPASSSGTTLMLPSSPKPPASACIAAMFFFTSVSRTRFSISSRTYSATCSGDDAPFTSRWMSACLYCDSRSSLSASRRSSMSSTDSSTPPSLASGLESEPCAATRRASDATGGSIHTEMPCVMQPQFSTRMTAPPPVQITVRVRGASCLSTSVSKARNASSPSSEKISETARPVACSITLSVSKHMYSSFDERMPPTVVLPEPIIPTR